MGHTLYETTIAAATGYCAKHRVSASTCGAMQKAEFIVRATRRAANAGRRSNGERGAIPGGAVGFVLAALATKDM